MAEGRGRVGAAGPVRGLAVAHFETEPPVVRVLATEAGQHAVEPGEGHRHRRGQVSRAQSASVRATRGRSGRDRPADRRRPLTASLRWRCGSSRAGAKTASSHMRQTTALTRSCDQLAEQVEPGVGVDASPAGLREHRAAIEVRGPTRGRAGGARSTQAGRPARRGRCRRSR